MTIKLIDLMYFNQDYLIWVYLGFNIVQAILTFIILFSILNRKINKISIFAIGVLYLITLVFVLFVRQKGVQGYEFNLVTDYYQWTANSTNILIALMNAILFLPLAYIFKRAKYSIGIISGIIIITLCEIAQYIFSLGIFDIGDIVLNSFGFIVGIILFKIICPRKAFT
jgi:hypothetical protein